jgi:serine phosphatase RsbU (regulator of sigma subunit)
LNEAKSIDNEQFGNERLLSELKAKPFKSCSERVEWMRSAVEKHTVGAEPSDDMTMMCIEVKK